MPIVWAGLAMAEMVLRGVSEARLMMELAGFLAFAAAVVGATVVGASRLPARLLLVPAYFVAALAVASLIGWASLGFLCATLDRSCTARF